MKEIAKEKGNEGYCPRSLALAPDGRRAAWGNGVWKFGLWDLETGQSLVQFSPNGNTGWMKAVAIYWERDRVVTVGDNDQVHLWDLATGQCLKEFVGHTGNVEHVQRTPEGGRALTGSSDGTLRFWDLATGRCLRTFMLGAEASGMDSLAMSGDGRRAFSSSYEKLAVWSLEHVGEEVSSFTVARPRSGTALAEQAGRVRQALRAAGTALEKGDAARALQIAATARAEPGHERNSDLLQLWRDVGRRGRPTGLRGAWLARRLQVGDPCRMGSARISADGRWAVCGSESVWDFRLWDLTTGQCLRRFEPKDNTGWMKTVTLCPDGRTALAGRDHGDLLLWDLTTGELLRTLKGHPGDAASIGLTRDGRRALSCGGKELRVWDLTAGRSLKRLASASPKGDIHAVSITPDGRWGLSCCYDDPIKLWDLTTGEEVRELTGHSAWVSTLCIAPDGLRALSGSDDDTVRLWELATGRCLRVLKGHTEDVTGVAFSPDGRWAFSASEDKTIRIWDLYDGECVRTLEGHTKEVRSIALSPDGRWLLSGSSDETLGLWELDWDYEVPAPADWNDGALPYLETFLIQHCPYQADGLNLAGGPSWNETELQELLAELQRHGFGWLRAEGVHRQLQRLTAAWQGPPPLHAAVDLPASVPARQKKQAASQPRSSPPDAAERAPEPASTPAPATPPSPDSGEKPKAIPVPWGQLIGGSVLLIGSILCTIYLVRDQFTWWSLLTGFFAVAGWGMIGSVLERWGEKWNGTWIGGTLFLGFAVWTLHLCLVGHTGWAWLTGIVAVFGILGTIGNLMPREVKAKSAGTPALSGDPEVRAAGNMGRLLSRLAVGGPDVLAKVATSLGEDGARQLGRRMRTASPDEVDRIADGLLAGLGVKTPAPTQPPGDQILDALEASGDLNETGKANLALVRQKMEEMRKKQGESSAPTPRAPGDQVLDAIERSGQLNETGKANLALVRQKMEEMRKNRGGS